MKNVFLFLIFISYILAIFLVNSYIALLVFFFINIILLFLTKTSVIKSLLNLYSLSFIIFITAIVNVFLGDFNEALSVSIKLILVCNITYIFKSAFGTSNLITTIEKIFIPFRFIGISPKDISLIINIGITFIPDLLRDFKDIRNCLLSKGVKKYSITYIQFSFKILFNSIFKRTNEIEFSLLSKGYME